MPTSSPGNPGGLCLDCVSCVVLARPVVSSCVCLLHGCRAGAGIPPEGSFLPRVRCSRPGAHPCFTALMTVGRKSVPAVHVECRPPLAGEAWRAVCLSDPHSWLSGLPACCGGTGSESESEAPEGSWDLSVLMGSTGQWCVLESQRTWRTCRRRCWHFSPSRTQEALKSGHFVDVLSILLRLQRICNHPGLVEPRLPESSYTAGPLQYRSASLILKALDSDSWKVCVRRPWFQTRRSYRGSGRLLSMHSSCASESPGAGHPPADTASASAVGPRGTSPGSKIAGEGFLALRVLSECGKQHT